MTINGRMDQEDVMLIYNETLVIKKNEILQFATAWKDLGGIVFSEISQTEKDEY